MVDVMGYPYPGEHAMVPPQWARQKSYPDTLIRQEDVSPLLELLGNLPMGTPVAVDTETTGLYPHEHDVIRGVSIAFRTDIEVIDSSPDWASRLHSFYIPVGYPQQYDNLSVLSQRLIFSKLMDRDPFLILHHGKFDFTFLRQLPMAADGGIFFSWPAPDKWWDTKVVAWLLDENLSSGLKEQAAYWWGEDQRDEQKAVKALIKLRGGWDKLTPEDTAKYAAKDAELTLRLFELQRDIVGEGPHPVAPAIQRELEINAVLARMERTGILIDMERMEQLWKADAEELEEVEAQLPFNPRSPKQIAVHLYDELGLSPDAGEARPIDRQGLPFDIPKVSDRSTAKAALERLPEHPTVTLLLRHRKLAKAISGYYEPIARRLGADGRLHATFWSVGTVTGRFSCSDPNLQTIPRGDTLAGVRDIFVAEPGFELWEYDLKAAEKRVLAGLSGEQILIDILEDESRDIHGELAARVFGPDYSGLQRRFSKNIGYGFDYGLTSTKTAAKYIAGEGAEEIAGQILAGLKAMYPKVVRLMGKMTRQAQRDGIVPVAEDAWPGRYRHFKVKGRVKRPAPFTALNFRIQGGIGELMKDVMITAEEPLAKVGARLCLQIHDALVIEVPEGQGQVVQAILQTELDRHTPGSFRMRQLFDANPWKAHE